MQTGLDKEKLLALKDKLDRLARNPTRLKLILIAVILLGGVFGLCRPQTQRIAEARGALAKIEKRAATAKDASYLTKQRRVYEDLVWPRADVGNWQNYVMDILKQTDVKLRRLLPRRVNKKGAYVLVELDLTTQGETADLLDLVDRLERGQRLVRIINLNLERGRDGVLVLDAVVVGLAKAGATKGKKSSKKGKAKGAKPGSKCKVPVTPAAKAAPGEPEPE